MSEKVVVAGLLAAAFTGFFYGFFYGRRLVKPAPGFCWQKFQWPAITNETDRYNQIRMLVGTGVFVAAVGAMLLVTKVWGPVVF